MGTPTAPGTVDRMLFSAVATQSQILEISLSAPGVAGKTALLALGVQQLNAPVPPATLLVDPLATFIGAFDHNGEVRFALPLPNLPSLTLYMQGIAIDFANPSMSPMSSSTISTWRRRSWPPPGPTHGPLHRFH